MPLSFSVFRSACISLILAEFSAISPLFSAARDFTVAMSFVLAAIAAPFFETAAAFCPMSIASSAICPAFSATDCWSDERSPRMPVMSDEFAAIFLFVEVSRLVMSVTR